MEISMQIILYGNFTGVVKGLSFPLTTTQHNTFYHIFIIMTKKNQNILKRWEQYENWQLSRGYNL